MAAKDYKNKVPKQRQAFKRKSQVEEVVEEPIKIAFLPLIILLSAVLILAFFIVNHFQTKGIKNAENEVNIVGNLIDPPVELTTPVEEATSSHAMAVDQSEHNPRTQFDSLASGLPEQAVKFSFYKELKNAEVMVDAEPIPVKLSQPYYILAGTFRQESRALKEQVRLKKKGLLLKISKITSNNIDYYRLRMGPFNDRLKMNKKRNELRSLGVDTLLVRAKMVPQAAP